MTLDQLRIFIAVAEREHLTQAANALALTPSAVSAAIRALEDRYGTPLFNRVGRRIELSEAGRIFLAEAQATLAMARNAELTLAELGGLKRGALRIHASQTIASYWLPALLVRFRQHYPQIELTLTIGNTQSVARAVVEGEADLGFVEGEIDEAELSVQVVAEDRIAVLVAPGHRWDGQAAVTGEELLTERWVLREHGSGTRSAFEGMLGALGMDGERLDVALTLPSNEAVCAAAMFGGFATVVSERVAAAYLQAGLLRKVDFALPARAFRLLRHQARYRNKASLALEALIA
ncbi:LysR family transcriptional regulator [Duganella sp. LX20W]|uniref:LysR family transcriptional regulator n=1 Tax=Rugamonas brunnea TaxID=2758569 RepID=A0A7W2ETW2_9BURK|nr:LysR family transcriptional regulator [Rugamonas brunnea]MBA5638494.1 LysR family transcriptional regulator [Rugamonas brunnea]